MALNDGDWDFTEEAVERLEASFSTSTAQHSDSQSASTVKALFRPYKLTLRLHCIEVEAICKIFLEYPLRPPLFSVLGFKEMASATEGKAKSSAKAGKAIEAVNAAIAMEHQVMLWLGFDIL